MDTNKAISSALVQKLLPKGPWQLREEGEANQWSAIDADGKWMISFRMNGEMLTVRQQAIAQVISAIPDLLIALRTIERLTGYRLSPLARDMNDLACEAIAKAEGRA